MTYSLHKQTQVQTAARQTLLKHFLLQIPSRSSLLAWLVFVAPSVIWSGSRFKSTISLWLCAVDIVTAAIMRHERAPEISASKVRVTFQYSLLTQQHQVGAEYQLQLSSSFPSMKKRHNCLLCVHSRIARRAYPYYGASAAAETERREACLPWLSRGSSIQRQPDGCSSFCSQGFPQANSDAFLLSICHLHLWGRSSRSPPFILYIFKWN